MPQYRIAFHDVTRTPGRDVYSLAMAVECDDEYVGLFSTTLDGRIFRLRTFAGEALEKGVRWAWVKATAELIEDSIRHGEAPQEWIADERPLAMSAASVIDLATQAIELAGSADELDPPAPQSMVHTFDCFTPDRNRWEFRSGRGKKRCTIDLRRGVRLLSDEVRHADLSGAAERPVFESPWSRPGVITLV
jgi:hypothetical protein